MEDGGSTEQRVGAVVRHSLAYFKALDPVVRLATNEVKVEGLILTQGWIKGAPGAPWVQPGQRPAPCPVQQYLPALLVKFRCALVMGFWRMYGL